MPERELPAGYEVVPDYDNHLFRLYCGKEQIMVFSMCMSPANFDPNTVYDFADKHAAKQQKGK